MDTLLFAEAVYPVYFFEKQKVVVDVVDDGWSVKKVSPRLTLTIMLLRCGGRV